MPRLGQLGRTWQLAGRIDFGEGIDSDAARFLLADRLVARSRPARGPRPVATTDAYRRRKPGSATPGRVAVYNGRSQPLCAKSIHSRIRRLEKAIEIDPAQARLPDVLGFGPGASIERIQRNRDSAQHVCLEHGGFIAQGGHARHDRRHLLRIWRIYGSQNLLPTIAACLRAAQTHQLSGRKGIVGNVSTEAWSTQRVPDIAANIADY